MSDSSHIPVLLSEVLEFLSIRPDGVYLDATLGRAGHASEIVKRLETGHLIAVDRDLSAIESAEHTLPLDKATLVHGNFSELDSILADLGIPLVDGMLFDLGVSSPQLDEAERGFSYQKDAPLDMRMNQNDSLTARTIVNTWPKEELRRILRDYGEERYAGAIAGAIVKVRARAPIETTLQLVDIIRAAMPPRALREKQHPAKRSFQGIRIAVNDEFSAIERALQAAGSHLKPGGRIVVISFHSLEDRMVKTAFQGLARGCICPRDFPVCVCGRVPAFRLPVRKSITAGQAELDCNPRARSARLRVLEKC